jgi:hypothetical protein
MPLPYSRRYEGLATGLRAAFEQARAPFAVTFVRRAHDRVAALLDGKVDLVVLSRYAADRLTAQHPLELVADLGPSTYVGAHGILVRHGVDLDAPALRVAVDRSSEDLEPLTERTFAGREDVTWVETSYMQLRDLFARGEADATVWEPRRGAGPHGRGGRRAAAGRGDQPRAVTAQLLRGDRRTGRRHPHPERRAPGLDPTLVTDIQDAVLRGDIMPSY